MSTPAGKYQGIKPQKVRNEPRDLTFVSGAPITSLKSNPLDIVLFCGSPGAGKSSFYWKHLQPLGYERVNQDILKTVRVVCVAP